MIPQEMHDFAVKMGAHERIIKKFLTEYSSLNNLKSLELHAVLSHLVYEIERDNSEFVKIRERTTEATKLHEETVNSNPDKVYTSAQEIIDETLTEDDDDDDDDDDEGTWCNRCQKYH